MERREHIYRVTIPATYSEPGYPPGVLLRSEEHEWKGTIGSWVCKKFDEPAVLCHTAVPQFIFTAMRLPLLILLNHW